MSQLAIITPTIGAPSETFIRRHLDRLLPRNTVVAALTDRAPLGGHWDVQCPKLIMSGRLSSQKTILNAVVHRMGLKSLYPAPTSLQAVRQFFVQHQVSCILAEYLDFALSYLPVAQELNIPFFAHAHGYDVSKSLRQAHWREEYLKLNEAAGVITMSEYSKQVLLELGIREEKVTVIPYGIDLPANNGTHAPSKEDIVRCFAVGRMVAKKAPILLLDAFRRALERYPNLRLDYVGGGELYVSALHFVQAFGLESYVTLHQVMPNEQVLQLLRESHIFLQHSVTCPLTGDQEGLPVAILEAMSDGLPVVSTRHTGIPEAVQDGITGFIVEEGDTESMAQRIVELATNAALREKLGKAARERVVQRYTWEKERDTLRLVMKLNAST